MTASERIAIACEGLAACFPTTQTEPGLPAVVYRTVGQSTMDVLSGAQIWAEEIRLDVRATTKAISLKLARQILARLRSRNELLAIRAVSDEIDDDTTAGRVYRRIVTASVRD